MPNADPLLSAAQNAADTYVDAYIAQRHIDRHTIGTTWHAARAAHRQARHARSKALAAMLRAIVRLIDVGRRSEAIGIFDATQDRLAGYRLLAAEAARDASVRLMEVTPT